MKKHWRIDDGVIINDGQGAYLTTDKDYGDVELLVDFKIGPKGDSGVYLRGTPQIQIWDFSEPSYARMGADKGSQRPVEQCRGWRREKTRWCELTSPSAEVEHVPDH